MECIPQTELDNHTSAIDAYNVPETRKAALDECPFTKSTSAWAEGKLDAPGHLLAAAKSTLRNVAALNMFN